MALLEPGFRCAVVHTEDETIAVEGEPQVRALLCELAEARMLVYVDDGLTRLRFMTDARAWQATVWNGKAVAMHLGRFKAIGLRGALRGAGDKMDALLTFLAWARGYGVQPASVGTMAQNLWRATLASELEVAADPEVSSPALFGGRQWAGTPRTYRHMAAFDIACAYPHAMWALGPYARRLVEVAPDTGLEGPGIARARVTIPWGFEGVTDRPFGALPVRLNEPSIWEGMNDARLAKLPAEALWWPVGGAWEGTWCWRELAAAQDLGYEVRILRSWAPVGLVEPFAGWEQVVREARGLPGAAGQLGKVVSVALWGTFALDGSKSSWTWGTPTGAANASCVGAEEARRLPQRTMKHWAAETSARVRVRLLMEGIYGDPGNRLRQRDGTNCAGSSLVPGDEARGGNRDSPSTMDQGSPGRVRPMADRRRISDLAPPVHVDTDGVVRRASAPCPEPAGDDLGQWRRSKDFTTFELRAPQFYRYSNGSPGLGGDRWHYVCSGVPEEAAVEKWKDTSSRSFATLRMPDGQEVSVPAITAQRRRVAALVQEQRAATEPPAVFVDAG